MRESCSPPISRARKSSRSGRKRRGSEKTGAAVQCCSTAQAVSGSHRSYASWLGPLLTRLFKWIEPLDADDPEYWLLSNLEWKVAQQLDPDNRYFRRYIEYITHLPRYMRPHMDYEAVIGHLGRIKSGFEQCYTDFVEDTGKTVVITLDTMETIRGMYLLLTITRWMKALPDTLFILSGRPLPGDGDTQDPIKRELVDDPYHP